MLQVAPGGGFFLDQLSSCRNFFILIFFQILTMSCSQLVIISTVGSFIAAVIMPLIVFCLSLCFKSYCKCQNSSPSKSSTHDVSKSESCVVNINNYYHSPVHGVFTHCNIPNSVRAGTYSIPNSNNQCIFVNSGSINSLTSSGSGSYFLAISEV